MNNDTCKTPDRDVTDVVNCTCANLRKATRVMTQVYDAALQPTGLKSTQFTLLGTLDKLGGLPLTQLAAAMVMDRTTLTRNLKPLIRKGLITIELEKDMRVRKIILTKAGKRLFKEARGQWEQVQLRIVNKLGPEKWTEFLDDLAETVSAISR